MPPVFLSGDLFKQSGIKAYAHGCNCAGAMGKGIAVEFKTRWPLMYKDYRELCQNGDFNLGDVFHWRDGLTHIFNLGTQRTWRTKARVDAIAVAIEKMIIIAEEHQVTKIGLPKIGAGLGGLDWAEVRETIIRQSKGSSVELYVFETYVPASKGAQ